MVYPDTTWTCCTCEDLFPQEAEILNVEYVQIEVTRQTMVHADNFTEDMSEDPQDIDLKVMGSMKGGELP